jgi:hypothetical protein
MKVREISRRAWTVSGALHLIFALLIVGEVSLKASTILDPLFYAFCMPGLLVGFPVAMLLGVGGGHGEGIFFGILFGLPFNLFAYYWLMTLIIKKCFLRKTKLNEHSGPEGSS